MLLGAVIWLGCSAAHRLANAAGFTSLSGWPRHARCPIKHHESTSTVQFSLHHSSGREQRSTWCVCLPLCTLPPPRAACAVLQLYAFGLFLGTIYSVPPMRLKRFAVPAFMIIATVRGFLLNFGVFHATRAALQLPFEWNPAIL